MTLDSLSTLDWAIIAGFFLVSLAIGIYSSRKAGKSSTEFFLSGRNMPWWLLGISMVATTFSADTPNVVTQFVREDGIAGNWRWWAFLMTGMLTVFVYAKLWRRSGVTTDLGFYELRYSGKEAAFLRGFRALYLGVFFNVVIMATVCVAAIKMGNILLGLEAWETLLYGSVVTVLYSTLGGLRGVILTDFVQFILAMVGAIWAAYYVLNLPEIGGLDGLLSHPNVSGKLDLIPSMDNENLFWGIFIIPLAVQWWSVWYPGAEPGGGGYIAQRMLAAKDEKNAVWATLLFNIAHYALRPWPWIIIALASLIMFPTVADISVAFPNVEPGKLGDDLGYPAMLSYLPAGLLGLVVASLIAAFMSTISTHLNWGSSYVVSDFYKRFVKKDASEKNQVNVGRISTVVMMLLAAGTSYLIQDAGEGFSLLLQIGAGTGLIFILRWFWWRVNAWSEISGMIISFVVAFALFFINKQIAVPMGDTTMLVVGVGITTIGWLAVTFMTRQTDPDILKSFYLKIRPYGSGWKNIVGEETYNANLPGGKLSSGIVAMLLGCVMVYAVLFGVGNWIYGNGVQAMVLLGIALLTGFSIYRLWPKIAAN